MVEDNAKNHIIDYVVQVQNTLNPKGLCNYILGTKVMAVLTGRANRLYSQVINFGLGEQAFCAQ